MVVTEETACWYTPPLYELSVVRLESGMSRLSVVLNHVYSALNGCGGRGGRSGVGFRWRTATMRVG